MRVKAFVVVVVIVSALQHTASASCFHKLYGDHALDRRTLSVPTTIIAKVVAPDIEVALMFHARWEYSLDCSCTPCCRAPAKQVASLSVSSSIRAFGGTVKFTSARSKYQDGKHDPTPEEACALRVELGYEEGDVVPAIGVGLSLRGATLRTKTVSMGFSAIPHCGCTEDPKCFGNTAPSIVEVSPSWLDLNKGGSATITIRAEDMQGNLNYFPSKFEGVRYLPTTLVPGSVWFSRDRAMGGAVYRVEFPTAGEELQGLALVGVVDDCGLGDSRRIPVRLFYPPVLTPIPEGSGWSDKAYLQMFVVDDPDFRGCNRDRWE